MSWKNYVGHDYEFIKICENNVINDDKQIKYISNIVGRHIDKIDTKLNKKDIEIILNKAENETQLTRSCVGYYNDQIIVGNYAYNVVLPQEPENVIISVKRLMGNGK